MLETITQQVEHSLNNDKISIGDIIDLSKKELDRLNIHYTVLNLDHGSWASFYPSLYISKQENASLLLVFPLHNNPLLISTMLYLATLNAPIDILAISPQNDPEPLVYQVQELLIHKTPAILWIDKTIKNSALRSLGGSSRKIPPLYLNKLLLENIPEIPITASTHMLQRNSILNFNIHDVPLEIFLDQKIPASYLKNANNIEIDKTRWIYGMASGVKTIAEEMLQHYPSQKYYTDWEGNYLTWNFFGKTLFISERILIIFFILLLFSTLFYGIYFRSILKIYASRIIKHWFIILCIILITIMINGTSSLLVWFIVRILGQNLLFERWAILLKLALTFFLFTILYHQLSRTPAFWAKNRYLSATALFFQVILLLIISSHALTFSFYMGISYLMTFFFSIVRSIKVKAVFLVLATIPLSYGLYNVVRVPSQELISFLLYNPILGNLVWTLTILPILLMIIRIDHLTPSSRHRGRASLKEVVALVFFACTTILLLFLPTPQIPVQFHETVNGIEQKRSLTVTSNTNLASSFSFSLGTQTFTLPLSTNSYTISLPYLEPKIKALLNIDKLGALYKYDYTIINSQDTVLSYVITHTVPAPNNFVMRFANVPTASAVGVPVRTADLQIAGFPPDVTRLEFRMESAVPPTSIITANLSKTNVPLIVESTQIQATILQTVIIQPE